MLRALALALPLLALGGGTAADGGEAVDQCLSQPIITGARGGGDYANHPQASANTSLCRAACCADPQCAFWGLDVRMPSRNFWNCTEGKPCCWKKHAAAATEPVVPCGWGCFTGASGRVKPLPPPPPAPPQPPTRDTDCRMRKLAYEYAEHLLPARSPLREVFDALRLGVACGERLPEAQPGTTQPRFGHRAVRTQGITVHVATTGDDVHGDGTVSRPYMTPHRARDAVRVARGANIQTPATVLFAAGTYHLSHTLVIGPDDGAVTYAAAPGAEGRVVLSGGEAVYPAWRAAGAPFPSQVVVADIGPGRNGPRGLGLVTAYVQGSRRWRARVPNGNPEVDLGSTNKVPSSNARWTTLPKPLLPALQLSIQGGLLHRGEMTPVANTTTLNGMRNFYSRYMGGFAERFEGNLMDGPPRAWCACDVCHLDTPLEVPESGQLGASALGCTPTTPDGVTYSAALFRPRDWQRDPANKPVLHCMNGDFFSSLMWEVDDFDLREHTLHFGKGGFQAGQASTLCAYFFVENVREEVDAPGEFFYHNASGRLWYYPNATSELLAPFIYPTLETLVRVQGSSDLPVRDVRFANLTFSHAAATYLQPFSTKLGGGDYAAHKAAALLAEGVDGIVIDSCKWDRVDGTALLLHSFVRRAVIAHNEFHSVGAHAIMSWGTTEMVDGTGPDHPHGTLIESNLAHEIGIWEKQTCFYMQALSTGVTLRGNVMFNSARALINFNDGFGGGHLVEHNLLFNAVRETGDHGPVNSYDRAPYLTRMRGTTTSYDPAESSFARNLIMNNFHAVWPLDHDDGSRYYNDHSNFFLYGGYENYMGNHKTSSNNIYVFPEYQSVLDGDIARSREQIERAALARRPVRLGYGRLYKQPFCAISQGTDKTQFSGTDEEWSNNTCITAHGTPYLFECGGNAVQPVTHDNRFMIPNASTFAINCGAHTNLSLAEWQRMTNWDGSPKDARSTIGAIPPDEAIAAMAYDLLGFAPARRPPP